MSTQPDKPSVLVVDDELNVRTLADVVLTLSGYMVRTAGTPTEALDILAAEPGIKVVLADVVLPEMTGYDFVDQAQRIAPSARIVLMSGHASDYVRRGSDHRFLPKPFSVSSLRSAIADAAA